jgi:hypothetical protein
MARSQRYPPDDLQEADRLDLLVGRVDPARPSPRSGQPDPLDLTFMVNSTYFWFDHEFDQNFVRRVDHCRTVVGMQATGSPIAKIATAAVLRAVGGRAVGSETAGRRYAATVTVGDRPIGSATDLRGVDASRST